MAATSTRTHAPPQQPHEGRGHPPVPRLAGGGWGLRAPPRYTPGPPAWPPLHGAALLLLPPPPRPAALPPATVTYVGQEQSHAAHPRGAAAADAWAQCMPVWLRACMAACLHARACIWQVRNSSKPNTCSSQAAAHLPITSTAHAHLAAHACLAATAKKSRAPQQ